MKNLAKTLLMITMSLIINVNSYSQVGSKDPDFNQIIPFENVYSMFVQKDGTILVGGYSFNCGLAKLNTDGSVYSGFNVVVKNSNSVYDIDTLSDGRIFVGTSHGVQCLEKNGDSTSGYFYYVSSDIIKNVETQIVNTIDRIVISYSNTVCRMGTNGTVESSFATQVFSGTVNDVLVMPNNEILVVHNGGIKKLSENGTFVTSFNSNTNNLFDGDENVIEAVGLQSDGKIIIGGYFLLKGGFFNTYVARLNSDGTLDNTFNYASFNECVMTLSVQSDDKIITGGRFTSPKTRICRLNANGTLDTGFDVGAGCDAIVRATTVQPDGRVLVGGGFSNYNGSAVTKMTRLLGDTYLRANICYVTVDTATLKSKVVWPKEEGLDISYYVVYKQITVSQYDSIGYVMYANPSNFVDINSEPESFVHNYKIRAVDIYGETSQYSDAFGTIKARNLASTSGVVELDWNKPEGIDVVSTYTIYEIDSLGNLVVENTVPGSIMQYTVTNPSSPSAQYLVGIDGMDDCGIVDKKSKGKGTLTVFSNPVREKATTTDISDNLNEGLYNFNIYPNPNNGRFQIDFDILKTNDIEINIYNSMGQVVYSEIENSFEGKYSKNIDLNSLSRGIYLININSNNKLFSNKIIIK